MTISDQAALSGMMEPGIAQAHGPLKPRSSVCLVGPGWRFTSGISYYTCRLANAFANQHDVSVIQIRRLLPRRFYPGRSRVGEPRSHMSYQPTISVFDGIDWWWGSSITRALSFVRVRKPDVVLLQWWTAATLHTYLLLAVAARALGSRVVVEMHESQDPGESAYYLARRYAQLGLRLLLRLSHGTLVHSEADRRLLENAFRLRDLPILVAPHGPYDQYRELSAVDKASEHRAEASIARVQAAPRPTVINLLSFGLIRPYKGLEDLLSAFDGLPDHVAARFWLTVVGETWENSESIPGLIERNSHSHRITFVNEYVADAAVAAAFRHADVVVLPYRRSSSSGVLHIAMSYGLPIVLTSVGGLPEAARDYDGAIFVPPEDPASLRDGIVQAARMVGRRFSDPRDWNEVIDAVLSLTPATTDSFAQLSYDGQN